MGHTLGLFHKYSLPSWIYTQNRFRPRPTRLPISDSLSVGFLPMEGHIPTEYILYKFGMADCKCDATPLDGNVKFHPESGKACDLTWFR